MMNWKKLLATGVAIGILLMLFQHTFRINSKVFQTGLLLLSILIFVVVFLYHVMSTSAFRKRVQNQVALMRAGKAEEALADMKAMLPELEGKKNPHPAALCRLNMSSAYRELKQFDQELAILEGLHAEEFEGIEQVVYLLNLACSYFYLDQDEKGLEIYETNKALFTDYDQHKRYGGSIAALLMFAKIAQGKADQAERLLKQSRVAWTDARSQSDYDLVEAKLAKTDAQSAAQALPETASEE